MQIKTNMAHGERIDMDITQNTCFETFQISD